MFASPSERRRLCSLFLVAVTLAFRTNPLWAWTTTTSSTVSSRSSSSAKLVVLQAVNSRQPFFSPSSQDRRQALLTGLVGWCAGAAAVQAKEEEEDISSALFRRQTDQFAYQFQPPPGAVTAGKPLKTHLDEVNFKVPTNSLQFGITVDPVRIDSLKDFGTPEEVAAKVVLTEVNRDGVFDVTLMEDPIAVESTGNTLFYQLNYLSVGKRGKKRNVARFAIVQHKLYALTAQCLEDDYATLQPVLQVAVRSFEVDV
jgi:hypothetical protein